MLGALGPFDIGQAAVIDGHVVAVDIEGTDGRWRAWHGFAPTAASAPRPDVVCW